MATSRPAGRQQPAEVFGGAENPFRADAHEADAAAFVIGSKPAEHDGHGYAVGQALRDVGFGQRLGRGEQQRLGDPHCAGQAQRGGVAVLLRDVGEQPGNLGTHAGTTAALSQIGAKARSCLTARRPSLTSSSVTENAEARTVRRMAGATQ